ncbi:hypothetical protein O0L34_g17959 [Tuta absoluta]|nr:hypothetical protein O0L34_g17959 [Tuta absoluta]
MDPRCWTFFVLAVASVIPNCDGWLSSSEEDKPTARAARKRVHYHTKRHMLPPSKESNPKKRPPSTFRVKEAKKRVQTKPTGHLTPLHMDDIDNDDIVSVAIGPPPMRSNYEKQLIWKSKSSKNQTSHSAAATSREAGAAVYLVKDVLTQIAKEFLTRQVNEDFVFGQYVGMAMKNITSELKIRFQHDILELVIKYQKLSREELTKSEIKKDPLDMINDATKAIKAPAFNDTEETWSDFTNLAKIVG